MAILQMSLSPLARTTTRNVRHRYVPIIMQARTYDADRRLDVVLAVL
jgi:hypothetical protein